MSRSKILLVDDNEDIISMMKELLEAQGFEVVTAMNVADALSQIVAQTFNVLITDLHMPGPGDGFSVVTAMRHAQPDALTLVVSGFPDVEQAMAAILLQADEVLVKPFPVGRLVDLIQRKTQNRVPAQAPRKESVASILERDTDITIQQWLLRVEKVQELKKIPLTDQERSGHLPQIIRDIAARLRHTRVVEVVTSDSAPTRSHGELRFRQGYSAPLIVQESRILQVCIFETIQRNLAKVDFSLVLPDVMLIADEVDSQLAQSIDGFLKSHQLAA